MNDFKKYFTLSFDDGLEQDKTTLKMMRKYGIKGTFNLNSGLFGRKAYIKYIGKYGMADSDVARRSLFWKYGESNRIPEDEIRQVYEGMELATHSVHHIDLSKAVPEEIVSELTDDQSNLQKYTDIPVVGHAFPFGKTSESVEMSLRDHGFIYARGVMSEKAKRNFAFPDNPLNFKPTCWHIENDIEELLDQFIAAEPENGDLLFYMWGAWLRI